MFHLGFNLSIPLYFVIALTTGCVQHSDTGNVAVPKKESTRPDPAADYSRKIIYQGTGSLTVTVQKVGSSPAKLSFTVASGRTLFEGMADLVLLEENGGYYVPQGTAILDDRTGQEYICDSAYTYHSEKISFVFAMENVTGKRLSFIVNNSSVENVSDGFFTLYANE